MRCAFQFLLGLMIFPLGAVPEALAAEGAGTAYVVTYFETVATSTGKARSLLQQLGRASRKEAGSLRFEILQRTGHPDQFVILEAWKDKDAQAAHAAGASTKAFREQVAPLLRGPYDERPHTALEVGPMRAAPAGEAKKAAIYAVTHVDIVPKEKDSGIALVKQLSVDGRKDAGNVRFDALTQASRTNHMTVVEVWADKKAVENHGMAAHKKAFREKLAPLSGSLYDERFYRTID
jgi:quinol monooxygenase YgiN